MRTSKDQLIEYILSVAKIADMKVSIEGGIAVNAYGYRRDTADVDAEKFPELIEYLDRLPRQTQKVSCPCQTT
jgi:hypothetical protein